MDTPIQRAAMLLGATEADIPGLWNAPGYPELTTGQLLGEASKIWNAALPQNRLIPNIYQP